MADNFRFRIRGLKLKNIREIEDIEIKFEPDVINPLLIRNGYGKTTMLDMLRWMFVGKIPQKEGTNWPQYKRDFGGSTSESSVELHLQISDSEDAMKDWQLKMWFDFDEEECGFETYSAEIGGKQEGWYLPPAFRSRFFQRERFVELFLFDGETARELTSEQDSNQVEDAILELTGLIHVKDIAKSGGTLDSNRTAEFKTASINNPSNAASKYMAAKEKVDEHIRKQESLVIDTEASLKSESEILANLEKQINSLANNEAAKAALEEQQGILRKEQDERKTLTNTLLNALGNPANIGGKFWGNVTNLHENLAKAKVPEGVGRQFFHDILDQDECVCGEPWTDSMKSHIHGRIEKYLADDIMTVVKSMQNHVAESQQHVVNLEELTGKISESNLRISKIEQEIDRIKRTFDKDTQERLEELEELQKASKSKIDEYNTTLDEITQSDPTIIKSKSYINGALSDEGEPMLQFARVKNCKNLFTLRKVQKALDKKMTELLPLKNLSEGTDIAKDILSKALENTMAKLRKRVESETNQILNEIPATGGGINVKFLKDRIAFVNDQGNIQEDANMATNLAGAYCFISSLASLGSMEPVLVSDSPVTGFENITTDGWVKEIWPFFKQAIFIMTPGERNIILSGPKGVGRDALEELDHFITVKREDEDIPTAEPQSGMMEVHYGREMFFQYAKAKEESI